METAEIRTGQTKKLSSRNPLAERMTDSSGKVATFQVFDQNCDGECAFYAMPDMALAASSRRRLDCIDGWVYICSVVLTFA